MNNFHTLTQLINNLNMGLVTTNNRINDLDIKLAKTTENPTNLSNSNDSQTQSQSLTNEMRMMEMDLRKFFNDELKKLRDDLKVYIEETVNSAIKTQLSKNLPSLPMPSASSSTFVPQPIPPPPPLVPTETVDPILGNLESNLQSIEDDITFSMKEKESSSSDVKKKTTTRKTKK